MGAEASLPVSETRRIFVAIEIPPTYCKSLSRLCRGLDTARWANPAQFHITLRFVGKTNAELLGRIKTELSCIDEPAFDLSLAKFGTFPDATRGRIPKVLWIRPGESAALAALQARVETAMCGAIGGTKQKAFSPHVTLARFRRPPAKQQLERWLDDASRFEAKPFAVNRFHLYDSELTPDGAIHTILATYPLS